MRHTTIVPLITSLVLTLGLTACGGKKDEAAKGEAKADGGAAKTDEAKADGGEAKAEGGAAKPAAAVSGAAPKGRGAADNDKTVLAALAGLEACKLNMEEEEIDECEGYDKFSDALVEAEEKDAKAVDRTLINLLGDDEDVVRFAAMDLIGDSWQEDEALIGTMIVALGAEKNAAVAKEIAYAINSGVDSEKLYGKFLPNLQAALVQVSEYDVFDTLYPHVSDCADAKACGGLLVAVAKGGATLEIRSYAADETLNLEHYDAEACKAAAALVPELSKQPVPKDDDDSVEFFPQEDAGELIDGLGHLQIGDDEAKAETCAAVIPGMIDALMPQVTDGTIHDDVVNAVLYLGDEGVKKADYMDKVKAFATAVKDSAKITNAEIKEEAKNALEDWKEG